ncbi:hypothetical protein GCK32_013920 [Trichostrongylus colubriformis]|uniref:Uncharacterized protein n=1 Tax=Trichostrongylus colubriformis TaxID=6319 RepID=A0AAN8IU01_TRICO
MISDPVGGVFALCLSRRGTLLSAGKDRTVAEWETTDLVRRRNPVELPDDAGTPKVILAVEGNQVVVGTTRNTLYVGDLETNFEEVVDGDSEDVTCCVAVQSHLFITASADGGVRQYNSSTKKREWRKNYGEGITCSSVDPLGTSLALGFSGERINTADHCNPVLTQQHFPIRCYQGSATSGELVDHVYVRDAEWASCNCRVSYEAGCLAHSVEGITSMSRSNSKDRLVIGRDNGSLRLYSCPVLSTTAGFLALAGHSHAVSSVTYAGERLITAGVTDNSLFQWKFHSN